MQGNFPDSLWHVILQTLHTDCYFVQTRTPLQENLVRALPSIKRFIKRWGAYNPYNGCDLPSSIDFVSFDEERHFKGTKFE